MPVLGEWNVGNPGVWRERIRDRTISLRHPDYPVEAAWTDGNAKTLLGTVGAYLHAVAEALELPGIVDAGGKFLAPLAWLALLDDALDSTDPRGSFWLTRYLDGLARSSPVDHTVVFVAAQSLAPGEPKTLLGSRLGLRVVAHLSRRPHIDGQPPQFDVRITSAARSIALRPEAQVTTLARSFHSYFLSPTGYAELKSGVRQAAGVDEGAPFVIEGARFLRPADGGAIVEVYANVPRPQPEDDPDALAYAVTATCLYRPGSPCEFTSLDRFPLVAHVGGVPADLLPQDPASTAGAAGAARPNRSPQDLEDFCDQTHLEGLAANPAGDVHLHDDLDLVKVVKSKLVDPNANESDEEVVRPADVGHPRMNAFAALSGYQRARARFDDLHQRPLFETIAAYGLSPLEYFRFARNPLLVRYRARIRPGPGKDGKTVNAQVDFDPCACALVGVEAEWIALRRGQIQVRFALADLQRSSSRREPLGLAADPRWSWHEHCHVLLAARTGSLEFRFAHSAGDALAAITSDPWSGLAGDPWRRGATFPWVRLHRRHDRSVYAGWGWCGRYHRPARFDRGGSNCRHKGYQSEQILSSSLFRLYRALGGDSVLADGTPDRPARERAADYAVYLILRMIRFLPPAIWNPIETPDQLVSALIDADIATLPVAAGPLKDRVGGWARKVVRWAFEAQGLYATTDPFEVVDAPGKPPRVDIFIDTERPNAPGDHPRGGYVPVSLDWRDGAAARWHASAAAMTIDAGRLSVAVQNRGRAAANGVKVRAWYIDWPIADAEPPKWDIARWTGLGRIGPQTVHPWPDNPPVPFGPFDALPAQPAGVRRLVLAAASCAADRANIDPASKLPTASEPTPIVDLVVGDNNLGLRLIPAP